MKHTNDIKNWLLMLLAVMCLWACSDSGEVADAQGSVTLDGSVGMYYLQLNIGLDEDTRAAHPYGGPDGDGTEAGRNHENDIHNICIFIYNDAEAKGVHAAAATPIKNKYYFDNLDFVNATDYTTTPLPLEGYHPDVNDRLIAVANHGNCLSDFNTLADFRSKAWDKSTLWSANINPNSCDYFTMTSAKDSYQFGKMVVTGKTGMFDNPYSASIQLERVNARVDFWFKEANVAGDYLSYTCENGTGTLKISHLRLFNMPDAGATYALKHAVTDLSNDPTNNSVLMGLETASNYIPTNYIFTPYTHLKNSTWSDYATAYEANSRLADTYNTSYLADADHRVHTGSSDARRFDTAEGDIDGDGVAEGTVHNYTIGYCTENTMAMNQQTHQYMTGLAVKGRFIPNKVYTMTVGGTPTEVAYTEGSDFWYYVDVENATDSKFFSSLDAARAYEQSRPAVAHHIDKYTNGECYYYIWIRHAQPDASHPTGTFPMEYAIVRNNIYRIGVSKVTGIGTPEPDDNPENKLYSKIYVRKWRLREHPEIAL